MDCCAYYKTKTVMTNAGVNVPNDILLLIFQDFQVDYDSLLQCALVNRAFWRAASKFLYRRVVFAPQFSVILSLRETPAIPVHLAFPSAFRVSSQQSTSNLISACLPQYAQFVEIIQINGKHVVYLLCWQVSYFLLPQLLPRRWDRLFTMSTFTR